MTDGKEMLLHYVTSYVSKWQDSFATTGMYNTHVTPYQAAIRHLKDLHPCEPEMWMTFASIKPAWSSSITKKYTPPTSLTVENDTTARKYRQRLPDLEHMSFLQWLRAVTHQAPRPKLYSRQDTLVGIKYLSLYKEEYFFQYVLMNHPHRHLNDLKPLPNFSVPGHLLYFKAATEKFPEIWGSAIHVREMLKREGHREHYTMTVAAYVNSVLDAVHMCAHRVLDHTQFVSLEEPINREYSLDPVQEGVVHLLEFCLNQRSLHYDAMNQTANIYGESDSDDDLAADIIANDVIPEHMDDHQGIPEENVPLHADRDVAHEHGVLPEHQDPTTWQRYIVIKGVAGTGKTHVIHACINKCITQGLSFLVATPTGKLATEYHAKFGDKISAETIHSAFHFPVNRFERPLINWALSAYDMNVIDEVSMVS